MAQARKRMVIIPILDVGRLLRDYIGDSNLPPDARATRIMVNPEEQGKLAVEFESPNIKAGAKDMFVHFDVKRSFLL